MLAHARRRRAREPAEGLRPYGVGDQATAVMRDAHGSWGYLKAWRNREDRPFSAEDLQLPEQVAPHLGSALRRRAVGPAILEDPDRAEHSSAGVLILDVELRFRSSSLTPSQRLTVRQMRRGALRLVLGGAAAEVPHDEQPVDLTLEDSSVAAALAMLDR